MLQKTKLKQNTAGMNFNEYLSSVNLKYLPNTGEHCFAFGYYNCTWASATQVARMS